MRLNALQRGQEVPELISQYCTDTNDLVLASHFRVVICTCSTSGQLFSLGLKSGHFSHVFVDEVSQFDLVNIFVFNSNLTVNYVGRYDN